MNTRIGLHTCGWGARPLPDLLIAARKLGYDGVELAPAWLEKEYSAAEVDRMLLQYGVPSVPTVYAGAGRYWDSGVLSAEIAKAREFCHWIKHKGGQNVIFGPVVGKNGQRMADEQRNIYRAYEAVGDAVISEGCVPLYHNHYRVSHELSKRIFKDDLDNMDWSKWKLCLDTGHIVLCLEDPVAIFDKYSDVIGWVHLKDVKRSQFDNIAAPQRFSELHKFFTPLGQGIVDFPEILNILDEVDYNGWLVVEQDYSDTTPYEAAKASIEYLKMQILRKE
jgi:inosose dehydratase